VENIRVGRPQDLVPLRPGTAIARVDVHPLSRQRPVADRLHRGGLTEGHRRSPRDRANHQGVPRSGNERRDERLLRMPAYLPPLLRRLLLRLPLFHLLGNRLLDSTLHLDAGELGIRAVRAALRRRRLDLLILVRHASPFIYGHSPFPRCSVAGVP